MKRFALIAAVAQIVVGCGQSSSLPSAQSHYPMVVHSPRLHAAGPIGDLPIASPRSSAQLVAPTRLMIATVGSSSCPSVPDELVVESRSTIRLHLVTGSWSGRQPVARPPASGICTADLGTSRMVVPIDPKLVDVHHRLTVRFFYRDSKKPVVSTAAPLPRYPVVIHSPVVLPVPRAQRGHLGIGSLKLVSPTRLGMRTWGSTTCPTVPKKLIVLGRDAIRIDLAKKYRGCTMDLRPRSMLMAIDPKLIDIHRPLTVRLFFLGSTKLDIVTVAPLKS